VLVAGLAVVLAAGCGGDSRADARHDRLTPTRTTATTAWQPTNAGAPADPSTAAAVKRLGNRFIAALLRHDPVVACATLAPSVRRSFAKKAGSCERAFMIAFPHMHTAEIAGMEVLDVRLRDGYAYGSVRSGDEVLTGGDGVIAQRIGGRWLLVQGTGGPSRPRLSDAVVREITATTDRYLRALTTGHWSAACATRTPEGRRQLAAAGGGRCENGVKAAAKGNAILRSLRAGKVALVDAGRATVGILRGDDHVAYEYLQVRRIGTRWLLSGADTSTYGDTYNLP
jgi:hypothetical protein